MKAGANFTDINNLRLCFLQGIPAERASTGYAINLDCIQSFYKKFEEEELKFGSEPAQNQGVDVDALAAAVAAKMSTDAEPEKTDPPPARTTRGKSK